MKQKLPLIKSFLLKNMLLAFLVLVTARSFSQTVFVAPTGSGTGATWSTAYTTLTAAIASGATKIYVKAGTYTGVYTLPTQNVYIKGGYPASATGTDTSSYNATSNPTTLDGGGSTSAAIFTVPSSSSTGYDVALVGLILTDDNNSTSSGFNEAASSGFTNAINYYFQDLIVTNNNTSNASNGVFYLRNIPTNSNVQFHGCLFGGATSAGIYSSTATNTGTALFIDGLTGAFTLLIDGCGFTNNGSNTGVDGGGIHISGNVSTITGGSYTISNSAFCNNTAGQYGGAIFISNMATINITNCNFKKNTAGSGSGAIDVENAGINATGCIFDQNTAYNVSTITISGNGGASAGLGPIEHLDNCIFYDNILTGGNDGAVYIDGAYNGFTVNNSQFYNNTNSYFAGAIFVNSMSANSTISNSTFSGNASSTPPGDLYFNPSGNYTISLTNDKLQNSASYYNASHGYVPSGNTYNYVASPAPTEPTVTCATPTTIILPITGLSLTAQVINGTPQLNWTTLTEQNTSYFAVQSSADGSGFTTIGKVAAAGNSNAALNYTFTDNAATGSVVYYRIQTVDKDGAVTISNIVAVRLSNAVAAYKVYPNPVTNLVNIETGVAGNYLVELFTNDGRKVQAGNISTVSGLVSFNINRGSIATGVYIIKTTNVNAGNSNYSTILVK